MHSWEAAEIWYISFHFFLFAIGQFERWAKEAGDGVTVKQDASNSKPTITKIDSTNPFWMAMQGAARQLYVFVVRIVTLSRVLHVKQRPHQWMKASLSLRAIFFFKARSTRLKLSVHFHFAEISH